MRERQAQPVGDWTECQTIAIPDLAPTVKDEVSTLQLGKQMGGLSFSEGKGRSGQLPGVCAAGSSKKAAPVRALVRQYLGAFHIVRIIEYERTALATCEALRLVEAER